MRPSRTGAVATAAVLAVSLLVGAPSNAESGSDTVPPVSPPATDTVPPTFAAPVPPTTATTTPGTTKPMPARRPKMRIASVVVDLDTQTAFVYARSRRLITSIPVSTGLWDSTPTGSFRVFSKSAQTFYTPSPDEKMRWMVRFTKGRQGGNIGFHGIPYRVTEQGEVPFPTPIGKAPSSHGCVRMRVPDARWLFDNIDVGTPVRVVRSRRG